MVMDRHFVGDKDVALALCNTRSAATEKSHMERHSDPSTINPVQIELCSPDHVSDQHDEQLHPWLQHYEDGVPAHIELPDYPLTWLLDQAASRHPHRVAFIYYGAKTTYAQFSHLAHCFAIGLQRLGVQKGDRVAIVLPNIPQFPIAFFGALRAGAVVVPTNPLYTEREMRHQLADSGTKVIVMLDTFHSMVHNMRQQTNIEHMILASPADFLPPPLRLLYPLQECWDKHSQPHLTKHDFAHDPTLHSMQSMLAERTKDAIKSLKLPVPTSSADLAVLQYTGGTTGLSKGAMLTHHNLLANAMQSRSWMPRMHDARETTLCIIPFFHAYGLTSAMNFSILGAATMILIPHFKAKSTLNIIHRYHPTIFPGIPTIYIALMRELELGKGKQCNALQSIKCCISGSAPLPAQVQKEFEMLTHGKLVEGYGLSEASPVTHANPLTDQCRNGSIGLPLPDIAAAIMDAQTGNLLPVGAIGEVVVKGPNIMQGYWNAPQETQTVFVNGWLRTGDIGLMDADGYFYIIDRAKDLIIASGFNVYPREVEEVLFEHPAVAEAAVTGITDSYRGETVAAFVVLKSGIEASEQTWHELLALCRENLAAYKVPTILQFRTSLPKSAIGKILRRELRQTYEGESIP
jgi:long-chain acyl-CoA synthetase